MCKRRRVQNVEAPLLMRSGRRRRWQCGGGLTRRAGLVRACTVCRACMGAPRTLVRWRGCAAHRVLHRITAGQDDAAVRRWAHAQSRARACVHSLQSVYGRTSHACALARVCRPPRPASDHGRAGRCGVQEHFTRARRGRAGQGKGRRRPCAGARSACTRGCAGCPGGVTGADALCGMSAGVPRVRPGRLMTAHPKREGQSPHSLVCRLQ